MVLKLGYEEFHFPNIKCGVKHWAINLIKGLFLIMTLRTTKTNGKQSTESNWTNFSMRVYCLLIGHIYTMKKNYVEFIVLCFQVPLEDKAVDVSVFCLSLMGTNLVDFVLEAHRITKKG